LALINTSALGKTDLLTGIFVAFNEKIKFKEQTQRYGKQKVM
jgi:hypothetical protein